MIRRILAAAALALALANPVHAADKYPQAAYSGEPAQPIKAGDTLLTRAPTTANASINLPHGTDPTSPNNGDCWTTTGGLKCHINGGTITYSAGGTPGGSSGQTQYNNAGSFGGFIWSGGATVVPSTGVITLGNPGPSTLGGIESITCGSHNWISTISTGGVPACTQPASSDVSGLGYFATGTDASNLTGTISVNRFNSGTSASSSTFLSGAGTWLTPGGTTTGANPSATISGSAVNGSASTFMRSDAAPALANTAVTPASYTNTNLTVDAQGRITAASNGSAGTGTVSSIATTSPICGGPITTTGTIAPCSVSAGHVMANSTSGSAVWGDTTVTALLDQAIGSTQGTLLVRGASTWGALTAGTAGYPLVSNGAGTTPTYQAASSVGIPPFVNATTAAFAVANFGGL